VEHGTEARGHLGKRYRTHGSGAKAVGVSTHSLDHDLISGRRLVQCTVHLVLVHVVTIDGSVLWYNTAFSRTAGGRCIWFFLKVTHLVET